MSSGDGSFGRQINVGIEFPQGDGFQSPLAVHGGDLDAFVNGDIGCGANSVDEIVGHRRPQPAADQKMHPAVPAAIGQIHRRLPRGISSPHHRYVLRVVEHRFDGCAGVVDSG